MTLTCLWIFLCPLHRMGKTSLGRSVLWYNPKMLSQEDRIVSRRNPYRRRSFWTGGSARSSGTSEQNQSALYCGIVGTYLHIYRRYISTYLHMYLHIYRRRLEVCSGYIDISGPNWKQVVHEEVLRDNLIIYFVRDLKEPKIKSLTEAMHWVSGGSAQFCSL